MFSKLFLCGTTVLVLLVLNVESNESGPIIVKSNHGRHGKDRDLILLGGHHKCGHGPTIIKSDHHRHHEKDLIMIAGENHCKHEHKKAHHDEPKNDQNMQQSMPNAQNDHGKNIKFVPVPYAVQQFVPVPHYVHVPHVVDIPVFVQVDTPSKHHQSNHHAKNNNHNTNHINHDEGSGQYPDSTVENTQVAPDMDDYRRLLRRRFVHKQRQESNHFPNYD